jgi:hypothetical protein
MKKQKHTKKKALQLNLTKIRTLTAEQVQQAAGGHACPLGSAGGLSTTPACDP